MKRTIVLIITIIIIVLSARFPHLMLNPGELTEGHQKIKTIVQPAINHFGELKQVDASVVTNLKKSV